MRFVTIKSWLAALLVLVLVGCGGGSSGDAGTPVLPATGSGSGGGGTTTGSATVSVALSSSTVTAASPATVTVTVRAANGNPIAGTVVDLQMTRGSLGVLSVSSVTTDASGTATATLSAAEGGASGGDEVVAVAKLGTTTVQSSAGFTVEGSVPTVGLTITSTTLRASTGAAVLNAVVKDAAGNVVTDTLVAFSAASGNVVLGSPSAKTDSSGVASVVVSVAAPNITAADTLTASATVGATSVQSSLVVQVLADVASLTVTTSQSVITAAVPSTVTVQVLDASGQPAGAGVTVGAKSAFGLTAFDAATAVTNAAGVAQFVATPLSASSNGADQIVVSATVSGVVVSAQAVVTVSATPSATVVSVGISPSTLTSATPAVVSVAVRDARGIGVPGVVVDLSTVRGGLATLSVSSVVTGAAGTAEAQLTAVSGAKGGADQVVGRVSVGTASIQGSAGFTVAGTSASVTLTASSTTLRASTGSATFSALVKDAAGNVVPNVAVSFVSTNGRVLLNAASAVTNASGVASVVGSIADPSLTAAETLVATATIGSSSVQGTVVVQLLSDIPSLKLVLSNSNVSVSSPALLTITVKDAAGNPASAGTIVSLSSVYGLSAFDATTVATNASGIAQAFVTPKSASSNGADQIVATAVVTGVTARDQTVVQILSTTPTSVALALSSGTVTAASPATVTVTVRDARGNPISGTVVDLSTVRGNLAQLSVASVATDSNGNATATLSAASGGVSGADQVIGAVRGGAAATQASASFTVSVSAPTLNLSISPSDTLRASTGTATLSALVKDLNGNPVPNLQVSFGSIGGKVSLGAQSAKTNGSGVAAVTVGVADAALTAADTLTASASVGGLPVQASLVVQLLGDTPSLTITSSNSNVTAAQPATLSILVKDAAGQPVGFGTIVQVSSLYGLSTLDAATVATNAGGIAQVIVTPKSASSNGADQIVASATVGGVTVTKQTVVQVSSTILTAPPLLQLALSSTSISSASPATVTATLTDGKGQPAPGEVVTFTVVRGLAKTNIGTALTDASGNAVVILSPASSTVAGADEVSATATYAGTQLQSTKGFQILATNVTLTSFTSAVPSVGAYGQTTLTLGISGASAGSPVNISVTSACVLQGKATLSPSTFTATSASVDLQFKDNGCGALQAEDKLQAAIVGGSSAAIALSLPIAVPTEASVAFISASPEIIYVRGSGFTETSTLIFEVRDRAGNPLQGRSVRLDLLTKTGNLLIEGGAGPVTQVSDATGRVSVRVNSGTMPTPVRVSATLVTSPSIATVSSNLSVGVGLPSQLNFSMSQQTINIEGMNIDGTPNTYKIIASDRNGNPVPTATSINFVTEGGQIEAVAQTSTTPVVPTPGVGTGLSTAVARFQSSDPRPADGRITVTAYALGEESFIDQNGNNIYDSGEPFQDLGNLFKDRLFDGAYDAAVDEYIPTNIANGLACLSPAASGSGATPATNALLALDTSIPSVTTTCDRVWSGAGQVYVRRAVETVLSTSRARALWGSKSGLDATCSAITLQTGPQTINTDTFTLVAGDTWYTGGAGVLSTGLPFIVADANTFPTVSAAGAIGRLNPMAAGTVVSASTSTSGLTVTVGGGSPVPSTPEATAAGIGVEFSKDNPPSQGLVFVKFRSPSGLETSYAITVVRGARPTACP